MNMNPSAKKYLRRVRSMLPCSRKMKKRIMEQIGNEISLFLKEHEDADYKTLASRYGEPENIAAAYIESVGTADILKKLRIRKRIIGTVAVVLLLVLVTWVACVSWQIIRNYSIGNGYGIISVE